jgi:hypothetical protein
MQDKRADIPVRSFFNLVETGQRMVFPLNSLKLQTLREVIVVEGTQCN